MWWNAGRILIVGKHGQDFNHSNVGKSGETKEEDFIGTKDETLMDEDLRTDQRQTDFP